MSQQNNGGMNRKAIAHANKKVEKGPLNHHVLSPQPPTIRLPTLREKTVCKVRDGVGVDKQAFHNLSVLLVQLSTQECDHRSATFSVVTRGETRTTKKDQGTERRKEIREETPAPTPHTYAR